MIYYTSDYRKIEYNLDGKLIGEGTQGKVYRLDDDKCVKVYKNDVIKIDPEVFKLLKDLSLDGYCRLYDLLYSDFEFQDLDGYIMQYLEKEIPNILLMPTEYTIHSFNILYNSIKVLAEYRIFIKDTIPVNAILTKDNVVLIDFDGYLKTNVSKEEVLEVNVNNLLYLFRRLFEEGLKRIGKNINDNELEEYLDAIFLYSKEPVKALEKRMSCTKTPMEVLPWKYRY